MSQEFIIFQSRLAKKSGTIIINKPKRFSFSKNLFSLLITIPIIISLYIISPLIIGEIQNYSLKNKKGQITTTRSKFSYILSPKDEEIELVIPKIAVHTKVLVNVDPTKEKEYNQILNDKAAHALGSNLPGQKGLIYLFGHSTNSIFNVDFFNPVFYNIKDLEVEDLITLLYQGKVYNYQINEKKIVEADDLSDLKAETNEEKLILQTCWPPGTDWKRLLLIANPIT